MIKDVKSHNEQLVEEVTKVMQDRDVGGSWTTPSLRLALSYQSSSYRLKQHWNRSSKSWQPQ